MLQNIITMLSNTRWLWRRGVDAPVTAPEQEQIEVWLHRIECLMVDIKEDLLAVTQRQMHLDMHNVDSLIAVAKTFGRLQDNYLALAATMKEGPSCTQPS